MAPLLTSIPRLAGFLLSEANGQRSRENIVVSQTGTAVMSGAILTRARDTAGAAVFAMDGGSAGNPTAGEIVVHTGAKPGIYAVQFTAPTKFTVEDPDGVTIGNGKLDAAFDKSGIGFTLAAGSSPAVASDSARITVALVVGSGKYTPYVAGGAAGPADAVLYQYLPAKTGDTRAVGFVRDCEVVRDALTGLDTPAVAQLASKGVIVRD